MFPLRVERKFCQENRFVACQRKNLAAFPIIHKMMSRDQAENYCRNSNYNGLARFTEEQMNKFNEQDFPIWIKLLVNGKKNASSCCLKMIDSEPD